LQAFLKGQILTRLPDVMLRALKARHYERVLRNFDEADEPDLKIVRRLVTPNMTAVDIGANIGVYTKVLASLTGPFGKVYCLEPVPETFAVLKRNVRALRMNNVVLVNAAVSDAFTTLTMVVPQYATGGDNFYRAQVVEGEAGQSRDTRRVHVGSTTLDQIAAGERIGFVKCDVEGHELKCLIGGRSVLERDRPSWLIEVSENPDDRSSSAADVFALLKEYGYSAWYFDRERLRLRQAGDVSTNYFFLTEIHISQLRNSSPELMA
jgi:FkbM family methyltransferase